MEHGYNSLPKLREDLDYKWRPISVDKALEDFADVLKRNGARAFEVDVYATNNSVYRNIVIQLPYKSEAFPAEDIQMQFNRDSGRQFTLVRT